MAVEYTKLWKILIDKRMKRTEMARLARISGNILAKLGKDEYVSLKSLEKICRTLDCDIGDIVSLKKDDSDSSRSSASRVYENILWDNAEDELKFE
jgi:DNA (cytosine-5)-methyltransferase 1